MSLTDLKKSLSDEVSTILGPDFTINHTETQAVPHSDDAAITFPNFDSAEQNVKVLESCVLYVDMRRSTELSLKHRPKTVAKLYSSFIRAMTRCASQYDGEVRGIIGDRVMMVFAAKDCFSNAVHTAFLINSVCKYILNKHFKHNDLSFGIGIDFGRMLVTKTGIRRNGSALGSYRSLVWLGRPANIASKLTDQANKPAVTVQLDMMEVGYAGGLGGGLVWYDDYGHLFVKQLEATGLGGIRHKNPAFRAFIHKMEDWNRRNKTPPILMTQSVYEGFKQANPQANSIVNGWLDKVDFKIDEYSGTIYGGDVIYTQFRD